MTPERLLPTGPRRPNHSAAHALQEAVDAAGPARRQRGKLDFRSSVRQLGGRCEATIGADALLDLRHLVAQDKLRYSGHAVQRMAERQVQRRDVLAAVRTALTCAMEREGRFRVVGGQDVDGQELTVIIALGELAHVVTVF